MALPMSPASSAPGTPALPMARGGYVAPPTYPADAGETINLDDFYMNLEQIPPAPAVAAPAPGAPSSGPEWTPAERPIIRPPVSGAAPGAAPPRRMQAQVATRPADDLGVEESELDKPTYLRRGLFAPE
jgi:hypothetical protein